MILGFLVLAAVLTAFQWKVVDLRNLVQTYRWTTDGQIASFSASWTRSLDAIIAEAQAQKQENVVKLGTNLRTALAGTDRKAIETAATELGKLGSRTIAGALGAEVRGHAAAVAGDRVFTSANLVKILYVLICFAVVTSLGIYLLGGRVASFLIGLPAVFALACMDAMAAGSSGMRSISSGASNAA